MSLEFEDIFDENEIPPHFGDVLAEGRSSLEETLMRYHDAKRNSGGDYTSALSYDYRSLANLGYLVEGDVVGFHANLALQAKYRIELFDRFDVGEPIDASWISMYAYKKLLDALASGSLDMARTLAERMGGRPELERKFDTPFETAMGYALKALVLGDDAEAGKRIAAIADSCKQSGYTNLAPYGPVLKAIAERDDAALEAAFPALLAGHRRLSKGSGMFSYTDDAYLFVWGIGLLNLARSRGMTFDIKDPLLPDELIVGLR